MKAGVMHTECTRCGRVEIGCVCDRFPVLYHDDDRVLKPTNDGFRQWFKIRMKYSLSESRFEYQSDADGVKVCEHLVAVSRNPALAKDIRNVRYTYGTFSLDDYKKDEARLLEIRDHFGREAEAFARQNMLMKVRA